MHIVMGFLSILYGLYGIALIVIGYVGIDHHLGMWWAIGSMVLVCFLRFTLPQMIGAYFGLMYLFEWAWYIALMAMFPSAIFIIPSIAMALYQTIRDR